MTIPTGLRQNNSRIFSYNSLNLLLIIFALALVIAVWAAAISRIEVEHQTEIQSTMRVNGFLAKTFAENIRRGLAEIDDELLFVKGEFEANGKVTPAVLSRIELSRSIPANHISVMDENGTYFASSLPSLVSQNDADRQYFLVHLEADTGRLYIDKTVIGRISGKKTVHISRRLNKPDGSLAGVVVFGFDPSGWANFMRELKLGDDYVVTLVGRDGIVRIRQTGSKTEDGMDVTDSPSFRRISETDAGSFIDTSTIDHTRRIVNYVNLQEYPLIVATSVSESEALEGFYQRRDAAYRVVAVVSVLILGFFCFLILMVEKLRQVKNSLEITVAERTQDLQQANEELLAMNDELLAMNDELQRLSNVDGLTGIANRRYFDEILEREWNNAKRFRKPLAIIMIDVDFFKAYNDTYGHQYGDECLKVIANSLQGVIKRSTDVVARYGGEEFAIILPGTGIDGAKELAERSRTKVESLSIEHAQALDKIVTISLGVAAIVPSPESTSASLVQLADQALYQAKKEGRNRVCTQNI